MTGIEKLITTFINKIQVSIPCKIIKISGMYADVEPLIYDNLKFPVIPSVPICFIGSSSINLKIKSSVGDIVTVFFTQLDLGKLLARGIKGQVSSNESFNLTNAFALPFNLHSKTDSEAMPNVDFEIIGNVKIDGDVEVTGKIEAVGDVKAGLISLKTHTHPYVWTGVPGAGNTSPPT